MSTVRSHRGFTLVDLILLLACALALFAFLVPIMTPRRMCGNRQMEDSTQVSGIVRAMIVWGDDHNGLLPLPSAIDVNNTTVAETGAAKDTTANIFSLLIYTGGIAAEVCISRAECNTELIQQDLSYEFKNPAAAVDPANALWDTAFSADFTNGHIGNVSYAHLLPSGPRLAKWSSDTRSPTDPIVGNRGPQIASVTHNRDGSVTPVMAIPNSMTLLIHGGRTTWEGNIGYADGHVGFESKMAPPTAGPYKDAAGKYWADTLFYDEPDDPAGADAYMGIFIKAGPKPTNFVPIWD